MKERTERATTTGSLPAKTQPDGEIAVGFSGVAKTFVSAGEEFTAISDVNLGIGSGRFVCLLGPSGCGKSTLLNLAAGLTEPTAGTVTYQGTPLQHVNHEVGYITQRDNLLPWLRVRDNVGIALAIRGMRRKQRRARVEAMLEVVGLTGFANRYPSELSGGMRKRVTLARSLIYDPSTLLMDEPFGALDAQLRTAMQQELLRLWERDRKTVLFVTHDVEEALVLADEIVMLGSRPGRVIEQLEVELPRPRDVTQLRADQAFVTKVAHLWSLLGSPEQDAKPPMVSK